MSTDPDRYVTITVTKVVSMTEKAFLISLTDANGDPAQIWLPKSQMDDPEGLEVGDENEDVAVSAWWANKEELIDE